VRGQSVDVSSLEEETEGLDEFRRLRLAAGGRFTPGEVSGVRIALTGRRSVNGGKSVEIETRFTSEDLQSVFSAESITHIVRLGFDIDSVDAKTGLLVPLGRSTSFAEEVKEPWTSI
jgi:hypothetical protein